MPDQNPFPQPEPASKHNKEDEKYLSLSRQIAELLARLRLLEERYANLRREHQTTTQNMIENHQNVTKQQRKLSDTLVGLKRDVIEAQEQITTMTGELADTAKAHELKALDRYVELWQPVEFITRKEAEELIARKVYKE